MSDRIVRTPREVHRSSGGYGVLRLRRSFASRMACFAQDDRIGKSRLNTQGYFFPYGREAISPFASWTVIVCPVAMFESLSTWPLGQSTSIASALVFDPMPKVSTSSLCDR